MRRSIASVVVVLLTSSIGLMSASLRAELKVPSSVFTMEELDEAKAEATEKEEPLIFVYTDPGTT